MFQLRIITLSLSSAALAMMASTSSFANQELSRSETDAEGYVSFTLSGSGFGEGPNVVIFDDFQRAPANTATPLDRSLIGSWTRRGIYAGIGQIVEEVDGNRATTLNDPQYRDVQMNATLIKEFESAQNIYISWSAKTPNQIFPRANAPYTFPSGSTFKMTWLVDGYNIQRDGFFDMVLPTHVSGGAIFDGNEFTLEYVSGFSSWWDFDNWVNISAGLLAGEDPVNDNGVIYFRTSSERHGTAERRSTNRPIFQAGVTTQFNQIRFHGWSGNGQSCCSWQMYYDNIYVATGPNAFARIDIADSPTYSDAKNIVTVPATSWSESQITFKVHESMIDTGVPRYVFKIDKDGNYSETGIPICADCTVVAPAPPELASID